MILGEKLSDQQCYYNYFKVGCDSGTNVKFPARHALQYLF